MVLHFSSWSITVVIGFEINVEQSTLGLGFHLKENVTRRLGFLEIYL